MPVRLGYLLCRIADTVEDDLALAPERKAELLDEFLDGFDDPHRADAFGDVDPRADQPATTTSIWSRRPAKCSRSTATSTCARRRSCASGSTRWCAACASFVVEHPSGIRIGTVPEFHQYCYYVAGTVGHLLTDLWHHHSSAVDKRVYAKLLEDCEPFGEALQSVNILKDIAWDAEHENSIYVPSDLLAAQGSTHDLLLHADRRDGQPRRARAAVRASRRTTSNARCATSRTCR